MYNYDVEMQSRHYVSTVEDAHRQRKLEADARRHRAPQKPAAARQPRRSFFAALRLRLEHAMQPTEEGLIA